MDLVSFITLENDTDLIVSFAVCDPFDPGQVESLTILRTPKYERFLEKWERGASLSFDRVSEGDEIVLLREVTYTPKEKIVKLRTDSRAYALDLRKVDPEELAGMCRIFRKMNFDSSIELKGVGA